MNLFVNKKLFFLLVGIFLLGVFLIIISLSKPNTPQKPFPTPTQTPQPSGPPIPAQGEEYQKSVEQIRVSEAEQIRRDSAIGLLLNNLPYTGINFSLSYDYSTNEFIAILNKNQELEANKELDSFLQKNNIADRSWFKKLVIKTE